MNQMSFADSTSASTYILAGSRARFLTDYYNYDHGWPEIASISKVSDESGTKADDMLNNVLLDSLKRCKEKLDRIGHLTQQIEKVKKNNVIVKDGVAKLLAEKKFPVHFDVGQLSSYLTKKLKIAEDCLIYRKKILQTEQIIRGRLEATLQLLQKDLQPRSNEAVVQQNKFLSKWNASRWQQFNTLPLITVRVEVPPLSTHSDHSSFSFVRGTLVDGKFGRFLLDNLQAVSCTPEAIPLAQLATSSAAGAVLVACIQSRLLVDACLNADLTRLRRQYPIDWDPTKRQLHLLTGRANILATLSVSASGSFHLVGLQYKGADGLTNVEHAIDILQSKLDDFTPPLSRSLDEWISEVNDFCTGIAESG
ncbi:hypothetical protein D915_007219 [Fasciola hepatica]|uniref:Uncharacterized protein n=1 Tax=Fasciola hepatica TaxID=6192 RepID=A0A4E0R523_FASHE|nr:hypothetical protein D915_007219 [Fasciola hepatica]